MSGTVTKLEGAPAAGASIRLVQLRDDNAAGESPANAAGEFTMTGVYPGSYRIITTLDGYERDTTATIEVIDTDITVPAIILREILAPTHAISGTVTTSTGAPAVGASVQIRRASDNTSVGQVARTDANGAYTITGLPEGQYNIIILLDGHDTGIIAGVTLSGADLTGKNIILQPATVTPAAITVHYDGATATVTNLPAAVTASKNGADVTLSSSATAILEYVVSGSTTTGSLKIQTPADIRLTLDNLVIASDDALPPVQITKNEGTVTVELKGASTLFDHSSNGENATLITKKGALIFQGYGSLHVSGAAKHAIASETTTTVRDGNITVTAAASDGIHAEGFLVSGGTLDITASGDGIDAGGEQATVNGGNIRVHSAADDTKGMKADDGITITGGSIDMTISGAGSKGISSKSSIAIGGGAITIVTSGATVLEADGSGYNPSYCTAIKSDADVTISAGVIRLESTAAADGGKGISADGDIIVRGGTLDISTAGDGKTYTASSGSPDSYTAACLKSDKNISLLDGIITCRASGTGGKCVNADGTITIGNPGSTPRLTATTSGERFLVTGSSSGGRPGAGFGDNGTDYANPKAIKCDGNMTVNSGAIFINCTQKNEGGEGLESKGTLTINGGTLDIYTHDDCINAIGITINGGNIFCASSGQDAIDSNAALTVNGGLTIANGIRGDGEAFDAERDFQVNGGIIVGTRGGNMAMTSPAGTQRSTRFQAAAGSATCIKNAAGQSLLLFTIPVIAGTTAGTTVTVTFSDPRLVAGTYTLHSGGAISGGTTTNGYNTGGTYSGGTSRSFTL